MGKIHFPGDALFVLWELYWNILKLLPAFFLGGTKVTMIFLQRRRPMQLDSTGLAWSIAAVIFLDS
jgi:hypothetical protein